MKKISIAEITIKNQSKTASLSFKEKIEIARLLDKMQVDVIALPAIENENTDVLLIKTISPFIQHSTLAVCVGDTVESVEKACQSLKNAYKARLQVALPVSTLQMEFIGGKKPAKMLQHIEEMVTCCKKTGCEVEFIALDSTRSEEAFLKQASETAIDAGADIITFSDCEGLLLPYELEQFIGKAKTEIPKLQQVKIGVHTSSQLQMGEACLAYAIKAGVDEIQCGIGEKGIPNVENMAKYFSVKGAQNQIETNLNYTQINRLSSQIMWIVQTQKSALSPFDNGVRDKRNGQISLTIQDDISVVSAEVQKLGYELSEEDMAKVYESFCRVAAKKDVGSSELDAIVASVALQVPATYHIKSYVINTGNVITSTGVIQLEKDQQEIRGMAVGDGPIDAAFLAIEQVVGCHYELDDFQIQAVTQGREAMGSALVKLRANDGKLYSGNGISTDIIGASIHAYVNALNKIVYEENQ